MSSSVQGPSSVTIEELPNDHPVGPPLPSHQGQLAGRRVEPACDPANILLACLGALGVGAGIATAFLQKRLGWRWPTILTMIASPTCCTTALAIFFWLQHDRRPLLADEISSLTAADIRNLSPSRLATLTAQELPGFLTSPGLRALLKTHEENLRPQQIAALPASVRPLFQSGWSSSFETIDKAIKKALANVREMAQNFATVPPLFNYQTLIAKFREDFEELDRSWYIAHTIMQKKTVMRFDDHQGDAFSLNTQDVLTYFPRYDHVRLLEQESSQLGKTHSPPRCSQDSPNPPFLRMTADEIQRLTRVQLIGMTASDYSQLLQNPHAAAALRQEDYPYIPPSIVKYLDPTPWHAHLVWGQLQRFQNLRAEERALHREPLRQAFTALLAETEEEVPFYDHLNNGSFFSKEHNYNLTHLPGVMARRYVRSVIPGWLTAIQQ